MGVSSALDLAEQFLGKEYSELGKNSFVSAESLRRVRMGDADILGLHGGGPHINFDILSPKYKSIHIFIEE